MVLMGTHKSLRAACALLVLALAGCDGDVTTDGGSSGGDDSDGSTGDGDTTGGDTTGGDSPGDGDPSVRVVFPPSGGTTAARVVVRGTVAGDAAVSSIAVAGVAAVSDDGFATWSAEVPLELGENQLDVAVVLAEGSASPPASLTIERWPDETGGQRGDGRWPGRILGLAMDPDQQRAVVSDDVVDGVFGIELATGDRTVLSDSESTVEVGSGYELVRPTRLALFDGHALVVDGDVLVDIDLATGDRTAVSEQGGAGSGATIAGIRDIATHPTTGRTVLLVGSADGSGPALVDFDRDTGLRTVLPTSGASLANAYRFAVDWSNDRALVVRQYSNALTLVNLATGSSTNLADAGEVVLANPEYAAIDGQSAVLWSDDRLVRVDLATGARVALSGDGVELRGVQGLASSRAGVVAIDYVPDWEDAPRAPMLIAIDPAEGTRVVLAR